MTINSATLIGETARLYSDAGIEDVFSWIQYPINRQVFERGNQIVDGIYMQVKPLELAFPEMKAIADEFAAWEAASDEDFLTFEKENS
jgi:hypothetical protein